MYGQLLRMLMAVAGIATLASPTQSDDGTGICKVTRSNIEKKYQLVEIVGAEKAATITAICSLSRIWSVADAKLAIGSGTQFYVCDPRVGTDARVVVVGGSLKTEKDGTILNNLGELSDCSHIKKTTH